MVSEWCAERTGVGGFTGRVKKKEEEEEKKKKEEKMSRRRRQNVK